jgi:hypothetical protein
MQKKIILIIFITLFLCNIVFAVNAGSITLEYQKINDKKSDLKIENYRDLSINAPIELVNDGLCTNSDYPYHLRISGGTTGLDVLDTYMGFVESNTFSANKKDVLDLIYNLYVPSQFANPAIEYLTVSNNQSLIKADKFNIQKNGLNQVFCLSKSFAGKKLNIFVWQSKDAGNKIDFGLGVDNKKWAIPETDFNNTGYLDKINYEFGYVIELGIPSSPFSNVMPSANTIINFNPDAKVSNIKYSISGNSKEYDARKIDNPESFIIDNKNKKKNVIVNLSGFNKDQPVFAIITTPEKLNDIDKELKSLLEGFDNFKLNNTDDFLSKIKDYAKVYSFKNYIVQSNYIINNAFKTDYWDSINFKLGTQNGFKFTIEKGTENDKFVLIFMQISPTKEINVAYTNLYILDKKEQSVYNLCEINRKIMAFYCKGEVCNLPGSCLDRWDFDTAKFWREPVIEEEQPELENVIETPSYSFNGKCSILKQNTLDEYINCLKNNLIILPMNKYYKIDNYDPYAGRYVKVGGYGYDLVNAKYSKDSSVCFGNSRDNFNKTIFSVAKKEGLTEEETAQLWSKLAAESGCSLTCEGAGGCHGDGIGQVTEAWHGQNEYNIIKKYLLEINSEKYKNYTAYYKVITNQDRDAVSATEIALALSRYNFNNAVRDSKNAKIPITTEMITIYDNDNAINASTIGAYLHGTPAFKFKNGINPIAVDSWGYTALHKLGYYLAYKKEIYNCHRNGTTNSFINAYKNTYGGKYCDKTK